MVGSVLTRRVRTHATAGSAPTVPCPGCGGRGRFEWSRDDDTAAPVVLGCAVRDVRGAWRDSGLVAPGQADHAVCVTASSPTVFLDAVRPGGVAAEPEIVRKGATGWRGAPGAPAHAVGDTATARILTPALPGDVPCNPRTS